MYKRFLIIVPPDSSLQTIDNESSHTNDINIKSCFVKLQDIKKIETKSEIIQTDQLIISSKRRRGKSTKVNYKEEDCDNYDMEEDNNFVDSGDDWGDTFDNEEFLTDEIEYKILSPLSKKRKRSSSEEFSNAIDNKKENQTEGKKKQSKKTGKIWFISL